jgi:glycosyltransferase involved in cell wall biosynthesis
VLPYKDGTQTGNIQVAYYCGTPVIVSNVGSLPELVEKGKTGFIIKPNDVNSLKDTIIKLLNSDYKKMGENAFEYYKNNLKWDLITKDLIDIFNKKEFFNDNKK